MADIQYWRDAIISEIEQIRSLVSTIPNKTDDLERNASIAEAEKKIRNAKGNCRSLKAEIRIVANSDERSKYNKELANYEQSLSRLTEDVQGLKADESRNRLFLGADTTDGGINGHGHDDQADPEKAGDALLTGAENIQDKTQVALDNTLNMVAESKATGMMTLEELERQRNQLNSVDQNVAILEDHLVRADRLIKTFGKRMATDKLIQCFACMNVVLIVAVVVYLIVKGAVTKEEGAPEDPVAGATAGAQSAERMLRGNSVW
mmetsp:Transcript_23213/g.29281  ORF Transcript_23213/g.29281 Transcript_23213/m.29281 type:complete len:263 (-) Transcript_23213:262-1050(-)|eukprot:CAMPEP_0203644154 /NCGR_PEP_ID=MMETSP0088-20131115/9583_1 /ASSEMBLY_ACC=CAM_ASM_001087 /TAXON_ID=426623 /ORGANISM="Chaetoceros affinis, Strain CCMP159" /LENGTH=262 /DNA_ID=CAMNT_0050500559 /DNA_START=99 /DNA_END=887 /DNA_ORIENTATION=+